MNQSFYKKLTICFLCFIIAFSAFLLWPNHKDNESELSKINSTQQKGTNEIRENNLFTPVKSEFEYTFKKYANPRANMIITLPSSWNVEWTSDRQIEAVTPDNDEYFPGTSFIIRYDFNETGKKTAADMIKIFGNELYGLDYLVEGESYVQYQYLVPTIKTETEYSNGNDDKIACAVTENIRLKNHSEGSSSKTGFSKIDYYIDWYDRPCVISCIVPKTKTQAAKKLLKTIVSNTNYCEQKITDTGKTSPISEKLKTKLTLPHQFRPVSENSDAVKIYAAPIDGKSVFSGMSLLTIAMETESALDITEDTIASKYGKEWLNYCFSDTSGILPTFYCEEQAAVKIGKHIANVYEADYTLNMVNKEYNSYFIPGDTWKMKICMINEEEQSEIIVLNYQECQSEIANEILKLYAANSV